MAPDKVVGIIGDSLTLVGSCLLAYDAFGEPSRVRSNQADLEIAAYFDKRNATYVSPDNKPVTLDTIETGGAHHGRVYAGWGPALAICGFLGQLASRILGP